MSKAALVGQWSKNQLLIMAEFSYATAFASYWDFQCRGWLWTSHHHPETLSRSRHSWCPGKIETESTASCIRIICIIQYHSCIWHGITFTFQHPPSPRLKGRNEVHDARVITLRVDLTFQQHGFFLFLLYHLLLSNALQGIILLP